eukprot:gnl/TRDRNA2_/TRDRNA2_164893_c0_seq2.p2 gnl/TRDRNA2_/TRDRNA2_164893_c0~~gnl/TRDRNA2_/TRDRNA2_164893_c0_seq2.p2  ORF type:complete len:107 (-),score=7.61 gnl/TRDRNA2_/TRDRNA2_164893_c0_seq2:64-384(-)
MPPQIKSKEAKAIAAANASKGKKKKWSTGKSKEKVDNDVILKAETYNKILSEVPKSKVITTSVLVNRHNINGSLARAVLKNLLQKKLIKPVHTARIGSDLSIKKSR